MGLEPLESPWADRMVQVAKIRGVSSVPTLQHGSVYRENAFTSVTTVLELCHTHSFASPLSTSFTKLKASLANATIFPSLSPPRPVSTSFIKVPFSAATASATYPLTPNDQPDILSQQAHFVGRTHGVLFLVLPPVGPAVPLSQTVYVDPNFCLTFSASPATTSGVGPL